MSRQIQPNFSGGIMGEGMYARADIGKYQVGVKDAANVTILPQGGLTKRAGFRRVGVNSAGIGVPLLVPFQFSADQTLMLEFWDQSFFAYYFGDYVLDTTFTPPSLSLGAGGAINLTDANLKLAAGDIIVFSGGSLDGAPARVLSVTASTFTVDIAAALDGGDATGVSYSKAYRGAHPYTWAQLSDVRWAQDGNDMYLVHEDVPPHRLRRIDHDNWTSEPVSFAAPITGPTLVDIEIPIASVQDALDPIITTESAHGLVVGRHVQLVTSDGSSADWPNFEMNVFKVHHVLSPTTIRLRRYDGAVPDLRPFPGVNTDLETAWLSTSGVGYHYGDTGENPNPQAQVYKVASVMADGTEGPVGTVSVSHDLDLTVAGNRNIIYWRPVTGAARYFIYKESGGAFGYIGASTSTYFVDQNIAPDMSQGPQETRIPFETGAYPSVIAFHEQRLFLAGHKDDPQRVEASQSARPTNFSVSTPPRSSDAISFRPRYQQMNAIRALVSGNQLLMLTSGGEWAVTGGDMVALTPDNTFLRPISHWGSDAVHPLLIGDVLLFAQRGGMTIRDFPLRGSGEEARPTSVTIMTPELFTSPVRSWTFSQTPNSTVWVALHDGTLLSMTYIAEHDIFGWTRHEIGGGGKVKRVASVLEADTEVVYAVVERGDGATRYVERLDHYVDDTVNGFFLDGATTVRSLSDVSSVRVPDLAGLTVTVVVDGRVLHDRVVDANGVVDAGGISGAVWHVGFPYSSIVETLPVSFDPRTGIDNFARMRASEVGVHVAKTRGVKAGRSLAHLEEARGYNIDMSDLSAKTEVYRVPIDGDWLRKATLFVVSDDPLPFTLLAVGPLWEAGG